jgi:transposase
MFQPYNQDQNFLLPPDFKEFLWESHEAVVFSEIIDTLDHREILNSYATQRDVKGRPAYNPIMMLKVLFYGYMNQIFSSRKIAKKCCSDIAFMYLAWNNKANFRSINRFRKEKGEFLETLFVQIVKHAQTLWLISFWSVSLDWTKIYANASKQQCYDEKRIEKQMKSLFDQAEEIDKAEDEAFWEENFDHIPEELRTKEGRDKKRKEMAEKEKNIQEKKKKLEKEIQKKEKSWISQKRINFTDTDARLMKMKRKDWGVGYNPQILTEKRFILSSRVPNTAEDSGELIPSLEKLYQQYNIFPKAQLADAGYASEENYSYLEKYTIPSYIPHQEKIRLTEYMYNNEENSYTDNKWKVYIFKQNVGKKEEGRKRGRPRKWEKTIEIIATTYFCSELNKYLYVNINWHALCNRNDERLYSTAGKELYKKRSGCVENVFGNIKGNLWFERFRLRGFHWVQIEWNLITLAHNLKKLISHRLA